MLWSAASSNLNTYPSHATFYLPSGAVLYHCTPHARCNRYRSYRINAACLLPVCRAPREETRNTLRSLNALCRHARCQRALIHRFTKTMMATPPSRAVHHTCAPPARPTNERTNQPLNHSTTQPTIHLYAKNVDKTNTENKRTNSNQRPCPAEWKLNSVVSFFRFNAY